MKRFTLTALFILTLLTCSFAENLTYLNTTDLKFNKSATNWWLNITGVSQLTTDNLTQGSTNKYANTTKEDNGQTAYTWGNHSLAGYGTSNYTDENADDRVAVLLQNNTYINWTYNDAGNTLTPVISGLPTYTNESTKYGVEFTVTNGTSTIPTGWYQGVKIKNSFTAAKWSILSPFPCTFTGQLKKFTPGAGAGTWGINSTQNQRVYNCSISNSTAGGGGQWLAYTTDENVNVTGNTGWIFDAPSGGSARFFSGLGHIANTGMAQLISGDN